MLALRMRQKDSEFYFVSYRAEDLLSRVRFETRFYGERGEVVGGDSADDRLTLGRSAADLRSIWIGSPTGHSSGRASSRSSS